MSESVHSCDDAGDASPAQNRLSLVREYREIDELIPAKINDTIYKPVHAEDPATVELAESMRQEGGVLEPLVITLDNVIVSGHRRRIAAKLAGFKHVPVRIFPMMSHDPHFVRKLRAFNNQRVKSFEEQVREAIIDADPRTTELEIEAYEAERDAKFLSAVKKSDLAAIDVRKARKRKKITAAKMPMLRAVQSVIDENRDFWPLTVRQVHYRLLVSPPLKHASKPDSWYDNDKDSYKNLVDLLTRARLIGEVPWESLTDATRPSTVWTTWDNHAQFVNESLRDFLNGYDRNPLQSQHAYVEVLIEKMTAETPVRRACSEYRIPYSIGRGYSSIDARHELAQRYVKSGKNRMVLLVLSDFDPEGENIAETMPASLRDEFGIQNVDAFKVALTPDQIAQYDLPTQMTAKPKSSRTKGFIEKHGRNDVYELEALPPAILQQIVTDALKSVIDLDAYRREKESMAVDLKDILALRKTVHNTVSGINRA